MHKNARIHIAVPAKNGAMTENKILFCVLQDLFIFIYFRQRYSPVHLYITQVNAQYEIMIRLV